VREAAELLKKGYVFNGNRCSVCAKNQADFSIYDRVMLIYETIYYADYGMAMPFYAFYKQMEGANGNPGSLVAFVPAFEVEGIEEYFAQRAAEHDHPYDD
jgi:hypothetical protein